MTRRSDAVTRRSDAVTRRSDAVTRLPELRRTTRPEDGAEAWAVRRGPMSASVQLIKLRGDVAEQLTSGEVAVLESLLQLLEVRRLAAQEDQ